MKPHALLSVMIVFFAVIAQASGDPQLEARVMALSQQLRCFVCQNETLADSHADLAADLRQQIYEQMKAGRSDREIVAFLTDRYGDFVLYRPPVRPRTYLLWFGPFLFLGGSFLYFYRVLQRLPTLIESRSLSADQRKRANDLLSRAPEGHS